METLETENWQGCRWNLLHIIQEKPWGMLQDGENRVWLTQASVAFFILQCCYWVTKNTTTAQIQKADGSRSSYWTGEIQQTCNLWNTKTMLIFASSCFFLYFIRPFVTEIKEKDTTCAVLLFQYIFEAGKINGMRQNISFSQLPPFSQRWDHAFRHVISD